MRTTAFLMLLAVALWTWTTPICAQDSKTAEKKQEELLKEPVKVIPFNETDLGLNTMAFLGCVAAFPPPIAGHPWGVLGVRLAASDAGAVPLPLWQFEFDTVFPIWHKYLEAIQDYRPLPSVFRTPPNELPRPDHAFYLAFNQAINRSHQADLDMFKKSAAIHSGKIHTHLKATPAELRGEIITVRGTIKLVRVEDPPRRADKEIERIYTSWIVPSNGPAYTVVFTELPPELAKYEKHELENLPKHDVAFHGYFLGWVRFPADAKGKKDMDSPYLVGKTLIVNPMKKDAENPLPPSDKDKTSYSSEYIIYTMGGIVIIALLIAVMNLWFRRGDRQIQSKLAEVRDKHQPFNLEPAEPGEEKSGPPSGAEPKFDDEQTGRADRSGGF